MLKLRGANCLVKTEDGFMLLNEYLKTKARSECTKLSTLINTSRGTFNSVVIKLLYAHNADERIAIEYNQKCNLKIN